MKKTLLGVAFATALMGCVGTAGAEQIDMAQLKCSEFLADKDNMNLILMWLDGYASQKSDNTVISDEWMEKLGQHMGSFCSANPDTPILEAAQAME